MSKKKNIIISVLTGGFGNQLFEYACAYAQARRTNARLIIDATFLSTDSLRDYELGTFNLHYYSKLTIPKRLPYLLKIGIRKIVHTPLRLYSKCYKEKEGYVFDKNVLTLRGKWRLHGYWQSEKYFKDYRKEILEMLTPTYRPTTSFMQLLNQIKSTESISVHVRRGDYVALGICLGDEYYRNALRLMCEKVKDAVFYVFSDNMEYAKELFENTLEGAKVIFVVYEAKNSTIEDFLLMKACKHNITANSSYSWWGAWANDNEDKLVICPRRDNKDDFYPEMWIQI